MRRYFNPFEDFSSIFRSFDNLFRQTFDFDTGFRPAALLPEVSDTGEEPRPARRESWLRWGYPAVESFRRGNEIVLRAELPGVDPKDLDMSLVDNQLVIRGEKREEHRQDDAEVLLREVSYGRFERSFTLPRGVKAEQLKASFNNGVLEVTLPAQGLEEAGKSVPIQISDGTQKKSKSA
jgi:HSP20 family protein